MNRIETDEDATIQQARNGDMEACKSLYERHLPSVRSWCWQITRNFADAEDLTQEVFMRLFTKLPTFHQQSTLRTWLYRVAVNCALMHRRQRKRDAASLDAILEIEASVLAAKVRLHSSTAASAAERVIIDQALAMLPAGKRSVFIMYEVSGLKHNEIAQRLGLSVEGSKCRLRRARQELRLMLAA